MIRHEGLQYASEYKTLTNPQIQIEICGGENNGGVHIMVNLRKMPFPL